VKGVKDAVAGYTGGTTQNPSYEDVSSGETGHAESVRVTFDPAQVSYGKLLQIFLSVVTDPTQIDRQGPDTGTQYRTDIFVADANQRAVAQAYIDQLTKAHSFASPIATRIDPAGPFYTAEAYHQNFLNDHPNNAYILAYDQVKIDDLHRLFPNQWQANPALVAEPK
jgi:peptide-methionine (S)-S-oxide reductase